MEKVALPSPRRTTDLSSCIDALTLIPEELITQEKNNISVEIVEVNPRLLNPGRTCDEMVSWAARASTNKAETDADFKPNKGLLRYLMRKEHNSPFEMVSFTWRLAIPIFVARQLVRHRTAKLNEFSGRYSKIDDFWYPEEERISEQSTFNNQGSGAQLEPIKARQVLEAFQEATNHCGKVYDFCINNLNVSRELARTVLPVNSMTYIVWQCDLRNFLHFCRLRTAPEAQEEIRIMAQMMENQVKYLCPIAHKAYLDYIKNSISLNDMEIKSLREVLKNTPKSLIQNKLKKFEDELLLQGCSKSEIEESRQKLNSILSE